ncbi:MAG: Maf family protein, partial [Sphingomicrobium sp.]
MTLVLASGSSIRLAMLTAAGVTVSVDSADIDEGAIKAAHGGDDCSLALALAQAKAIETSRRSSQDWVIGGDSLVSVDGQRFDKPVSRADAADHLHTFSGQQMRLTSAVALARNGTIDWSHAEQATLHIRPL